MGGGIRWFLALEKLQKGGAQAVPVDAKALKV
jgi:hypothetical protein